MTGGHRLRLVPAYSCYNVAMADDIDYATPVGMVRALIPDCDLLENPRDLSAPKRYLFTDAQLGVYLSLNNGNVKRAAADAIDVIGTDTGLQMLVITTDDKSTDGAKMLNAMLARGKQLRASADGDESGEVGFELVQPDFIPRDWAWH